MIIKITSSDISHNKYVIRQFSDKDIIELQRTNSENSY